MPQSPSIEIVLTNWKRKDNLPKIVAAMREQSVRGTITLIDNAFVDADAVDAGTVACVDKYFRIKNNPYGPYLRYACHGFYDADCLFVLDDDMLPGNECLAHFSRHAVLRPEFGLLGQFGRCFHGHEFHFHDMPRSDAFTPVDLCLCGYFINRAVTPFLDEIKRRVVRANLPELFMEDDMLLSAACRLAGREIALTPRDANAESALKKTELPQPFALSSAPNRPRIRREAWERIRSILGPLAF